MSGDTSQGFTRQGVVRLELPSDLAPLGVPVAPPGLAGTGDDSIEYTVQGMKGVVSRFGLTLPAGVNPALKNAAAVLVTADLPAFSKPGRRWARPSRCVVAR